jgi:hypothetical protein
MAFRSPKHVIPVNTRQAIFLLVVEAQDKGRTVVESRAEAAIQFSVTVKDVVNIEHEGLANQWPPL